MATSICGWVEYKIVGWFHVIYTGLMVDDDYRIFGIFFGVRGSVSEAIAPHRGFPDDVSWQTKRDFEDEGNDAYYPTWITWQEISAIDWQKPIIDYWSVNGYELDDWTIGIPDRTIFGLPPDEDGASLLLEKDDPLLDRLKTPLQAIVDANPGWTLLFAMMKQLAERYGSENVRLVVWFR